MNLQSFTMPNITIQDACLAKRLDQMIRSSNDSDHHRRRRDSRHVVVAVIIIIISGNSIVMRRRGKGRIVCWLFGCLLACLTSQRRRRRSNRKKRRRRGRITTIMTIIMPLKGQNLDFYTIPSLRTDAQVSRAQSCANQVQHIGRLSLANCRVPRGTEGQLACQV